MDRAPAAERPFFCSITGSRCRVLHRYFLPVWPRKRQLLLSSFLSVIVRLVNTRDTDRRNSTVDINHRSVLYSRYPHDSVNDLRLEVIFANGNTPVIGRLPAAGGACENDATAVVHAPVGSRGFRAAVACALSSL